MFGSDPSNAATPITVNTVASNRKRKVQDPLDDDNPAVKRVATSPVVETTPSVTTAMSSDEDFMSDPMSEDDYDNDSLGELGMHAVPITPLHCLPYASPSGIHPTFRDVDFPRAPLPSKLNQACRVLVLSMPSYGPLCATHRIRR